MGKLIIAESEVSINRDGLYCLNDLHKAAVANGMADENTHRPSIFTTPTRTPRTMSVLVCGGRLMSPT